MRIAMLLVLPLLMLASVATLAQDTDKPAEKPAEVPAAKIREAEPAKAEVGKKAPGFTLKNAKGDEVKLADFADKLVVIEWVNFDCPWVKKHYEEGSTAHVEMQKKVRDEGGVWLTICSSAAGTQGHFEGEVLTKRIEKVGADAASYLIDTDGTVGKKYDAKTTPHMFVVDKAGVLRYDGALDNLNLRQRNKDLAAVNYVSLALEALKADKEVETKTNKPYGCNVKYAK